MRIFLLPLSFWVQLSVGSNSDADMALDIDGDGNTEFTLTPNSMLEPEQFLDTLRETILSLDLRKSIEKQLLNKVKQAEKKLQKGKVGKFDKRINQLNAKLEKQIARLEKQISKGKQSKSDPTELEKLLLLIEGFLANY